MGLRPTKDMQNSGLGVSLLGRSKANIEMTHISHVGYHGTGKWKVNRQDAGGKNGIPLYWRLVWSGAVDVD